MNALSSRRGLWGFEKSSSITFCSPEVSYLGAGKLGVEFAVSLIINGHRDSQRDSPAGLSVTHQGGSSCTCPSTTFHSVCIKHEQVGQRGCAGAGKEEPGKESGGRRQEGMMGGGGTSCQITPGDLTAHTVDLGGALCSEKCLGPPES